MKTKLTILFMLFMCITYLANGQDLALEDFEDQSLGPWSAWSPATAQVIANPVKGGINTSDYVMEYDQTAQAWKGVARWQDPTILSTDYGTVVCDVYIVGSTGSLKLYLNGSDLGAATLSIYLNDIPADTWFRAEFDVSNLDTLDYKQIAFQSDVQGILYIDNVKLIERPEPVSSLEVENIIDAPNIADEDDYSVVANMNWDADSLYIVIDVTDELIWNDGGDIWEQDNIEIYFDMDNSKAGSFDDNDFQLRLANDSGFYNTPTCDNIDIEGVRMVYKVELDGNDTIGYVYDLAFPWDSLMADFDAVEGTQFGFDILASDNDGDPVFRDQISWNSPSGNLYNTPYYWGVLELAADGTFTPVVDDEAPSGVTDLTATLDGSTVTLTWTTATDNRAVGSYIITQDDTPIDTIDNTSIDVTDLAEGTYTFGVTAVDIYGNMSSEVTVDATIAISVISTSKSEKINFYPNPVTNILTISGIEGITRTEVVGLNGTIIKTFKDVTVIDLSEINKGLYVLKVYTKDIVYTFQIFKK